ncbi:MAG: Ig-like domain-containing protein [Lachnospiraceae bacterium]|nr:Ig-like domain-containing protein [Lachnospiraceae bacterium]
MIGRRIMKMGLAVGMSLFMGIGSTGTIVFENSETEIVSASTEEEYATSSDAGVDIDIPQNYIDDGQRVDEYTPLFSLFASSKLPSAYDARGYGVVTSVKNQGSYGTCWAFASIGAVESAAISAGLASAPDYSEYHLAYFTYHNSIDPLGNLYGDETNVLYKDYLNIGGNNWFSLLSMAAWKGPAAETNYLKYSNASPNSHLSQELAYSSALHVQNAYVISMKNKDDVKRQIVKNGGVAASFAFFDEYCNSATGGYYQNVYSSTNHAIMLIGWDDTYSKTNFKSDGRPSSNGAWLAKNSWGNYYDYMWISYEDLALANSDAFSFYPESADNYDYNYQYDGTGNAGVSINMNNGGKLAQVFTVNGSEWERLEAASIMLLDDNISYKIEVYKNPEPGNPASGTPVTACTTSGVTTYAGLYTIPLNEFVDLKRGERFSIIFTMTDLDTDTADRGVRYLADSNHFLRGTDNAGNIIPIIEYINHSEPDQSYVGSVGAWRDVYQDYTPRIKAYTSEIPPKVCVKHIIVDKTRVELAMYETVNIKTFAFPLNATDRRITYKSLSPYCVTVDSSGNITANEYGVFYVLCTAADGYGATQTIEVVVNASVESIGLSTNKCNLKTGESQKLDAHVMPATAADKSVVWSSSDSSVVTVSEIGEINAVGEGEAYVSCAATDGSGVVSTCRVTVSDSE